MKTFTKGQRIYYEFEGRKTYGIYSHTGSNPLDNNAVYANWEDGALRTSRVGWMPLNMCFAAEQELNLPDWF